MQLTVRQVPRLVGKCYSLAADYAVEAGHTLTICRVNLDRGGKYHAIVEKQINGKPHYRDVTLEPSDLWFDVQSYATLVGGMEVVRRLSTVEVIRFVRKHGYYPSPATLGIN